MGEYAAYEGALDATGMRFAIVAARFNDDVTEAAARRRAATTLREARRRRRRPCAWVPGAFELPLVAQAPRRVAAPSTR